MRFNAKLQNNLKFGYNKRFQMWRCFGKNIVRRHTKIDKL